MNTPETKPPRTTVTLADIQGKVKKTTYTVLPDGKTTVCQLHMENGYTINGYSACVDPANYNQALGEKYSYEDAINKAWPLEGYLLAEEIFKRGPVVPSYRVADVDRCAVQSNPMTGCTQYQVKMKDGKVFSGELDLAGGTIHSDHVAIIEDINKQLKQGAQA